MKDTSYTDHRGGKISFVSIPHFCLYSSQEDIMPFVDIPRYTFLFIIKC